MPPATLIPRPAAHERRTGESPAHLAPHHPAAARGAVTWDGVLVDPAAVAAARDAVARYLGEVGLPVNGRAVAAAVAACLDAALGEVGADAEARTLARTAVRHAALGAGDWLAAVADVPTGVAVPPHAAVAAASRVGSGDLPAVPAARPRPMAPQRFR